MIEQSSYDRWLGATGNTKDLVMVTIVFGSRGTLAWVAIAALGGFYGARVQPPVDGLAVKDGKGRVRLATIEEGDSFSLVMYDADGRSRASLQIGTDGHPLFTLADTEGRQRAVVGEQAAGCWCVGVRDPGGLELKMVSGADGSGSYSIASPEGKSAAYLGASGVRDEAQLYLAAPSSAERSRTVLWASAGDSGGMYVERGADKIAGLMRVGERSVVWMGDDVSRDVAAKRGVFLAYEADKAAQFKMACSEAFPIHMATGTGAGAGIRFGDDGASSQLSVSAQGEAKVSVSGRGGDARSLVSK